MKLEAKGLAYIYALCEPNDLRAVRYIGKTSDPDFRYRTHLSNGRRLSKSHKAAWISQLRMRGLSPVLEILEVSDEANWQAAERAWIAFGRQTGWVLTNHTDGGEGLTNPAESVRRRIGDSRLGKPLSAEIRHKMSVTRTGKKATLAHRQAISVALRHALAIKPRTGRSSRYAGVSRWKHKWQAQAGDKYLGLFICEEDARDAVLAEQAHKIA